jgi:hypothetical protein
MPGWAVGPPQQLRESPAGAALAAPCRLRHWHHDLRQGVTLADPASRQIAALPCTAS